MKKILILWYNVTFIISMVLSPIETYASDETVPLETTEILQTSEYQVSEADTIATEDVSSIESSSDVQTEDSTYIDTTEDSYISTTATTTYETTTNNLNTTITDITSSQTTTDTQTNIIDTIITTLEQNIYVENVSIVTNIENTYSTIDTTSTNKYITTNINNVNINNDSSIHTLASANIDDTDASPETKQITFLIPILLLMVGAMFMGATSTPKKR